MSIKIVSGNLLDAKEDIICHQVNCQGVMGAGVAKQIREKWPEVYTAYMAHCYSQGTMTMIGRTLLVPIEDDSRAVINMFAQNLHKPHTWHRLTSYDAFYDCLEDIRNSVSPHCSIAFPYGIGCGLGGGNWYIIYTMIYNVLGDRFVVVYKLDESDNC